MTHQEYRERLEEILTRLENQVAIDVTRRVLAHTSGQSPKGSHLEAKQAIDRLFLDVIEQAKIDGYFMEWNGLDLCDIGQIRNTITGKEGGDE